MNPEQVIGVINELYGGKSSESVRSADKALRDWQHQSEAWVISDRILSTGGMQTNHYYFMSQTIRSKIQYDFHQLSRDSLIPLKDSLFAHIQRFMGPESRAVRTQLCIAIADLSLQLDHDWPNPLRDITSHSAFANHPEIIIDLLRLLPEETDNMKVITDASKRHRSRDRLIAVFPDVCNFLNHQLQNPALSDKALECFLSWLRFYAPPMQELRDSAILAYALNSPQKSDNTSEVILEALFIACKHPEQYMPVVERIFPSLVQLKSVAVAADSPEQAKPLCKLFTLAAECLVDLIAKSADQRDVQDILGILLHFISFPCSEVSDFPIDFFCDLSLASAPASPAIRIFAERLVETLVARCAPNSEDGYAGDPFTTENEFFGFRRRALNAVSAVAAHTLGLEECCGKLVTAFAACIDQPLRSEALAAAIIELLHDGARLQPAMAAEAAVAVARVISPESIHAVGDEEKFRRSTFCELLSALSENLPVDQVEASATVLARVFLIHEHFSHKSTIQGVAARAFRSLMQSRREDLSRREAFVIGVCEALRSANHVKVSAFESATEGVLSVLNLVSSDQLFQTELLGALDPPLQAMRSGSQELPKLVDRVTTLIRCLRLPRGSSRASFFGSVVAPAIWQTLEISFVQARGDAQAVEKVCRVIKHVVRAAPDEVKSLLPKICDRLVAEFQAQPRISSFLYVAEILGDTYGQTEGDILARLFDSLAETALHALRSVGGAGKVAEDADEVLEDLCGMCARYYRHTPLIIVRSRLLPNLIEVALTAITRVTRRETFQAIFAFVTSLLDGKTDDQAMSSILLRATPLLVKNIFIVLAAVTPQAGRSSLVGALESARNFEPHAFTQQWLPAGLAELPAGILSAEEQQQALREFCGGAEAEAVARVELIAFRCEQRSLRGSG